MSRGKGASTGYFLSEPNRILSQSIKGKSETNPKLYSKPFVFDRAAIEGQHARNQRVARWLFEVAVHIAACTESTMRADLNRKFLTLRKNQRRMRHSKATN